MGCQKTPLPPSYHCCLGYMFLGNATELKSKMKTPHATIRLGVGLIPLNAAGLNRRLLTQQKNRNPEKQKPRKQAARRRSDEDEDELKGRLMMCYKSCCLTATWDNSLSYSTFQCRDQHCCCYYYSDLRCRAFHCFYLVIVDIKIRNKK